MKRLSQPLVYVSSEHIEGFCTQELYKELRLQMSTGDFHTHMHYEVTSVDPMSFEATEDVYGTVSWFDRVRGEGVIECEGERISIYACNIKGGKTWYSETACVYYEAGQVVECHIDVHGYSSVFCIGDTQGTLDLEAWDRIKDQKLAFRCDENGKAINGLFE